jgi:phosphatidate phosphatase APP1
MAALGTRHTPCNEPRTMNAWTSRIARLAGRRARRQLVVPYRGYGTAEVWYVRGRVLADNGLAPAAEADRRRRNLLNTLRRLRARGAAGAGVRARGAGTFEETTADNEGFFNLKLHPCAPWEPGKLWYPVDLELAGDTAHAVCPVLVPPPDAEIGIISDIDDTVIRTDVTRLIAMLRIVLLTNAHTRLPFPGVAAFYRALHRERNPIFYVSSSPWNFYDLLEHMWEIQDIPLGPLFLQDYDLKVQRFGQGHHTHKLAAIRTLLDTYPTLDWVLIGDSGQQDPEIYRQVVRDFPGRIQAVYIRDVTSERRDREVHAIAKEVEALGVPMLLVRGTVTAAEHAAAHGLLAADSLAEIYAESAADLA